jgi:hypothetical protein
VTQVVREATGRRWRYAATAAIAACAVLAPSASATLPPDFFGVYSEDAFTLRDEARSATLRTQRETGYGMVRLPLDWSTIQPDPDRWVWTGHDDFVLDAARAGMRILPFLVQSPGWAREPEKAAAAGIWPPQFPDYIIDFATAAAARYGPGGKLWRDHPDVPYLPIRAWQIWNEPNITPFWPDGPNPVAYTRLLASAALGIRSVDPGAEIVAAGMPDSPAFPASHFLSEMYDAGAGEVFDTAAVHPYARTPDGTAWRVRKVVEVVAEHGDDARVWATEFGWATGGSAAEHVVDENAQADHLSRALTLLGRDRAGLRLRGIATYSWRDSVGSGWMAHAGLRRLDNSPKPALFAVRAAIDGLRAEASAAGREQQPPPPGDGGWSQDANPRGDPSIVRGAWRVRIFSRRVLRAGRSGRVTLGVRCGSAAVWFCSGSAWLELAADGRAPGRRLGSAAFTARSGRTARVTVRLTARARRLLARSRRVRVTVRAGATDLHARDSQAAMRRWLTR